MNPQYLKIQANNVNINITSITKGMYLLIINTEEKIDGYFDTALIKRPFPEIHADCMANT